MCQLYILLVANLHQYCFVFTHAVCGQSAFVTRINHRALCPAMRSLASKSITITRARTLCKSHGALSSRRRQANGPESRARIVRMCVIVCMCVTSVECHYYFPIIFDTHITNAQHSACMSIARLTRVTRTTDAPANPF